MNNIVKLETSIYKLIEKHDEFLKVREKALKDAENAESELKKAKETINDLKLNFAKVEKISDSNLNIENKKEEIIKQIKSIIARLDRLNIDDITNV